ncbi:NlpC/P60 family protein, partial [Burkholderia multivorans]
MSASPSRDASSPSRRWAPLRRAKRRSTRRSSSVIGTTRTTAPTPVCRTPTTTSSPTRASPCAPTSNSPRTTSSSPRGAWRTTSPRAPARR